MKNQANFDLDKFDHIKVDQSCPSCKKKLNHYMSMSIFTKKRVLVFNCTNEFCKQYSTEAIYDVLTCNLEYTLIH